MLYSYPYIKTDANKLHVFVCKFMRALRTGSRSFSVDEVPDGLKTYIDRSNKLKEKVETFINAYNNLHEDAERKKVMDAFVNSNAIEALLRNCRTSDLIKVSELHPSIQGPTRELFKFLFKVTLKLDNMLKDHYDLLYKEIEIKHKKVCPFCGLETLVSPRKGTQDYDHLLYKDEYAFAAVNMRNLVPMGTDCNRRYKKTTDVIRLPNGDRRPFCYPFKLSFQINLDLS
jgi:hypothetical protein